MSQADDGTEANKESRGTHLVDGRVLTAEKDVDYDCDKGEEATRSSPCLLGWKT
jgi:hypothetical protein